MTRSETQTLRVWIEALPRDGRLDLAPAVDHSPSPLLPVDLADLVRSAQSWPQWLVVAPNVMRRTLERPDAMRVWRGVATAAWLRGLIGCRLPEITSASDLRARPIDLDLPHVQTLYRLSTAPLEWVVSAGPSKLSSPLGMAIVKVRSSSQDTLTLQAMRCIYGFSESDLDAATDPGCLGTDDVSSQQAGVRELGPALFGEAAIPLSQAIERATPAQLALPALILALNSRPTLHLPVLLGIAYALNGLHGQLAGASAPASAEADVARMRLGVIASRAAPWLERAIDMGFEDDRSEMRLWSGDVRRWSEGVVAGFELGLRGLSV